MKYAVGIDLGGTFIKYAIVSDEGKFFHEEKIPSNADKSADAVISQLELAIKSCISYAAEDRISLAGIGIGTPGIVDNSERIIIGGADNIVGWTNIPLADILEAKFHLAVKINNDANLMGFGEQASGAAKDCSDVLFITVGTGIGGAIIIDGKLYGGYQNRGTELGHIPFVLDGKPCSCGSVGCWEAYASTSAMIACFEQKSKEQGMRYDEEIDGKLIVSLYKENHSLAKEIIEEECKYLGRGIAALVNIFSPQRVVIGGGISESGDFFIDKITHYTKLYVMPDCFVNTEICAAQLGNKAGVAGAAKLIFSTI
jgi:glucokinase